MQNKLKKFGNVEFCGEDNGMYKVSINDGYSTNTKKTLECMDIILKEVGNEYPIIHKFVTDDNSFLLILKKY